MAKSKKSKSVTKSSSAERELSGASVIIDDIELLNYYKYSDFYPQNVRDKIMANKNAQKRIEDLIRDNPVKKSVRSRSVSGRPNDFASIPESGSMSDSITGSELIISGNSENQNTSEEGSGLLKAMRRWFP
jgi:hypothetical protein